jgi:hypothetical protein
MPCLPALLQAFQSLLQANGMTAGQLLANKALLSQLLQYHLVREVLPSRYSLGLASSLTTAGGAALALQARWACSLWRAG